MNKIRFVSAYAERDFWAVHITRRRPDGRLQAKLYIKPSKRLVKKLSHLIFLAAGNSFRLIPTVSIIGWQACRQP